MFNFRVHLWLISPVSRTRSEPAFGFLGEPLLPFLLAESLPFFGCPWLRRVGLVLDLGIGRLERFAAVFPQPGHRPEGLPRQEPDRADRGGAGWRAVPLVASVAPSRRNDGTVNP